MFLPPFSIESTLKEKNLFLVMNIREKIVSFYIEVIYSEMLLIEFHCI